MAKKTTEVPKYVDKDGDILLESSKFEYEVNTYQIAPGSFNLVDSKTEKASTFIVYKNETKKEKGAVIKIEKLLIAAPLKWLDDNKYKKI